MSTTATMPEAASRPLYRFSVEQYHRIGRAGIIGEGMTLINGVITVKNHYRDGDIVPYPFDAGQYDRMVELGILTPRDKVELIHGRVVSRMGQNDPHAAAVEVLNALLTRLLPDTLSLRSQLPVVLPDDRPEPDVVVCASQQIRGRRHPRPGDVSLIVEVGDTTVQLDRTVMLALYASVGIPEYWVVSIPDRRVEVYTVPGHLPTGEATYLTRTDYAAGQAVPVVVAGVALGTITVDDVLP